MSSELDQAETAAPSGLPPGPADGFGAEIPLPAPALPFEKANVPCLRDCKHFTALKTYFEHGNPSGTFAEGSAPMQNHYWCSAMGGEPLELTADAPVYECNRWDPTPLDVLHQLAIRREDYIRQTDLTPTPTTNTEGHNDSTTPGDRSG